MVPIEVQRLLQHLSDTLRGTRREVTGRSRQDDRELVATQSGHCIRLAQYTVNPRRHLLKQAIAALVP
jgi:hypothetical protein